MRPGMPPMMHPRPPGPMYSHQRMPREEEKPKRNSSTIESGAVIYAPPQIKKPVKEVKEPEAAPSQEAEHKVAPGIEVNVPLVEMEPEMPPAMPGPAHMMGAMGGMGPMDPSMMMGMEEGTSEPGKAKKEKKKKFVRTAAGVVWEDPTLAEWDPADFRVFCGDLGNEVTDEMLQRTFSRYPTFVKAKVVRDKRTNKTKGYGFVSFKDPNDFVKAMREMNGKYVGNRPIKLRKSAWRDRALDVVRKKDKEKKRLGFR